MKPLIHAESSVKQFGGKVEDYLPIHDLLDSSKSIVADQRHRIFTHNTWFLMVLERVFGSFIVNSEGKRVSVRDVGEQHILEDYRGKFIPSGADWLEHVQYADWMRNGEKGEPRSAGGGRGLNERPIFFPSLVPAAPTTAPNSFPNWPSNPNVPPTYDGKPMLPQRPEIID